MVAGQGRQAVRNEIVVRVARFHFDDLALLADVFDAVDQQQFHAAALALGEGLEGSNWLAVEFYVWFSWDGYSMLMLDVR